MTYRARWMSGAVAAVIAVVLVGCSAAAPTEAESGRESVASSPAAVEVEDRVVMVDLRIARSLVDPEGTLTDEAIVTSASDRGMEATIDGDTIVYTMSRTQRDEMLSEMRSSVETAVGQMVADDTNSVTDVEFDDAMTSFRVSVDRARYTEFEALLALGFYIPGALFQQFSGVAADDIDVVVEFVDDATGEVLETGSYREMRENLGR